jgi:hypothetical protein
MRHSDAGVEARFATLRSVIAELVGAEPGQAANPETPAIGR